MIDAEKTVVDAISVLLRRRNEPAIRVSLDSDIYDDLLLDSLEVAEFSAVLEDNFGTDPYSEGVIPRTVGEVVAFYAG